MIHCARTEPIKHAGDCSIYGAGVEICDCGALLRAVTSGIDATSAWLTHLAAIDRSKWSDEPKPSALAMKAAKGLQYALWYSGAHSPVAAIQSAIDQATAPLAQEVERLKDYSAAVVRSNVQACTDLTRTQLALVEANDAVRELTRSYAEAKAGCGSLRTQLEQEKVLRHEYEHAFEELKQERAITHDMARSDHKGPDCTDVIRSLQRELAEARKEIDKIYPQADRDALRAQLEQAHGDVSAAENTVIKVEAENERLRSQLEQEKARVLELAKDHKSSIIVDAEHTRLKAKLSDCEEHRSQLAHDTDQYLADAKRLADALEQEKFDAEQRIEHQRQIVERQQRELEQEKAKSERLEWQGDDRQLEVNKLKRKVTQLERGIDNQRETLSGLHNDLHQITQALWPEAKVGLAASRIVEGIKKLKG